MYFKNTTTKYRAFNVFNKWASGTLQYISYLHRERKEVKVLSFWENNRRTFKEKMNEVPFYQTIKDDFENYSYDSLSLFLLLMKYWYNSLDFNHFRAFYNRLIIWVVFFLLSPLRCHVFNEWTIIILKRWLKTTITAFVKTQRNYKHLSRNQMNFSQLSTK